jgi:hypothetical protein
MKTLRTINNSEGARIVPNSGDRRDYQKSTLLPLGM